jgi:Protein of unknown function (DUF2934)
MSRAYVQSITRVEAWRAYQRSFHQFSESVRHLQALATDPHPNRTAIEAALVEVEKARVDYDGCRDALAQQLLPASESGRFPSKDPPQVITERVKSIAELLWESAGRPEGTADEDWRLAEEIVKRAATAA